MPAWGSVQPTKDHLRSGTKATAKPGRHDLPVKTRTRRGPLRLPEFPIRFAALRVQAQPFGRLRRPGHGPRLRPHDLIRRQSGRANQENADPSREPGLSVVLLNCLWCPIQLWKAQPKRYDRKTDARFRLGPGDQSQKFWSVGQESGGCHPPANAITVEGWTRKTLTPR